MLEARSPLVDAAAVSRDGVTLSEAPGFTLTQISGDIRISSKIGEALARGDTTTLRIAPKQAWIIGPQPAARAEVFVTPLSSGRTRFLIEGPRAREVLARSAQVDFDAMTSGEFVMTSIHHTPVLIHCTDDNSFHIYALRTFALAVWEWLADAIEGLAND